MQTQYFWNTGKLVDKKTLFFFQKSKYLKNCKSVTWTGFPDLENKSLSRVPNIKKIIWTDQLEVVLRLQIIIFVLFFLFFYYHYLYTIYVNDQKTVVQDMPNTTRWHVVWDIHFFKISEEWMDLASKLHGNSNKY